ncbi:MAG: ABC transporter ATP-binding protein [Bacteroidetes bacterium]|nr:MAG: ABC transporter ATP-binding protein [Bacteroidota bacterium]
MQNFRLVATDNIVKISSLKKSFDSITVLNDINLNISEGENLVVLGKSGAGKSTLIRCLIGLIKPDEGEICIFGKKMSEISYEELNELRLKMGFLFQNSALYDSMSVRQNLAFPLRRHKKEYSKDQVDLMVEDMLEHVGLKGAIDKMPAELSGGMSKRIGLARTLMLNPAIMLYDEPTGGLDTVTAKEIIQLILDLQKRKKISSLIITHDLACARMTADRIVMIKEGSIVAEGTYEELEKSKDEGICSYLEKS